MTAISANISESLRNDRSASTAKKDTACRIQGYFRAQNEILLTENQYADFRGISPRTAQGERARGRGPKFVRFSSRCIRYRLRDVLDYLEQQTRTSTSDIGSGVA